jgi:uncharacterized RDD family membrane protein YckC
MRSSIYDALEVSSSAPVHVIQVALRRVVRRFWAVPRDASGDSEEAVRFAALGASILVDTVRRKDYDAALNPGVGAGPWRLPIGGQPTGDGSTGSTNSRVLGEGSVEPSQLSIEAKPPTALPGVDALAEPLPDGTAWASPLVFVGVAAAWLLLCYGFTLRFTETIPALGPGEALLVATGVAAVLMAIATWLSRAQEPAVAAASLSRLAIIKWRREGSIFIGVPPPQHDTAWIFKLRLMELTRSAAGFVTATSVLRRLAARLIDYALVALVVYFALAAIGAVVHGAEFWFVVLRSPVVLPILVALAAIPAEAAFYRAMRTTPGKWLLGLVPVIGTTRPADHSVPGDAQLAWSRAASAAWSGAALGFWPLSLVRLARHVRLARELETDWDARGDSIVMARPLVATTLATGLMVLVAASLILFSGWRRDYSEALPHLTNPFASIQSLLSGLPGLSRGAPASTSAPAGDAQTPATAVVPTATEPVASAASPAMPTPTPAPAAETAPAKTLPAVPPPPVVASPPAAAVATAPSAAKSVAETEMSKQANAAHARRLRIDGYMKQAESARRSGSYGALLGNCQRWTQDQPGSAEAWRCFGLAQYQNGAGRDALPALRQALKLEPNDSQVEAAILKILRP